MKRLFSFAFILCLLAGILIGCSDSSTRSDIIPDAPPCYVELEMDGEKYMEYASEGQIWMLFKDYVSSEDAVKILTDNNAKIIDQDPDIGYYAVSISVGTEGAFVAKLKNLDEIDFVYPNAIQFENSVSSYVIDKFEGEERHGKRVQELFEKASLQNAEPIDVTFSVGSFSSVSSIKRNKGIRYSLKDLSSGNGVVINLSSGVLPDMSEKDWQGDYIKRYVSDLKGLIKLTRKICKDEIDCDFVFVKSSGNVCLKHLERVLDGLKEKLDPDEYAFFKEHFILVSARDDNRFQNKKGDYPNDVYDGGYHNMVSKIDISDLTATDSEFSGTSFSAPRLAGYIVRAANQFKMPVTKVLQNVRSVTKKSPNHIIDYEMIEKEIKGEKIEYNIPEDPTFLSNAIFLRGTRSSGSFVYEIPYESALFNSGKIFNIKFPNGDIMRYEYRFDDEYVGMTHDSWISRGDGYWFAETRTYRQARYVDPWFDKVDSICEPPMHYIAFWLKHEEEAEGRYVIPYMVTARLEDAEDEWWIQSWRGGHCYPCTTDISHTDIIYDLMENSCSSIFVTFFTNRY